MHGPIHKIYSWHRKGLQKDLDGFMNTRRLITDLDTMFTHTLFLKDIPKRKIAAGVGAAACIGLAAFGVESAVAYSTSPDTVAFRSAHPQEIVGEVAVDGISGGILGIGGGWGALEFGSIILQLGRRKEELEALNLTWNQPHA